MSLREQFSDQLKASMKAGTSARTATLRMILARLKDTDIAARPKGVDRVPDEDIVGMLRGMVKSRRESVELYRQGHRQDLVDKEEAEIAVIEAFLPQQMDEASLPGRISRQPTRRIVSPERSRVAQFEPSPGDGTRR